MAYNLEEQEQLASLKAWWNQYGNLVTWVLIIALGAFAAWTSWKGYQRNQSSSAALLYEELQKAVTAKDAAKTLRTATDIQEKFSRTAYAQMAALAAAKTAFDANDLKSAKAQLEWVITNGRTDDYKAIAKIRLAGILLDEKTYDEALKQLSGDFPEALTSSVADRKGDILTAQNKLGEARAAFQLALEKMNENSPARQVVQTKLDAIGGAPAKPAA